MSNTAPKPTGVFIFASWLCLVVGLGAYGAGLWNTAEMQLNEKGYYLTVMLYGLFSAVSLQKTVRDRMHGIPVTHLYVGLCWASLIICITLLSVGLWNAHLALPEKGFYGMSFVLSLFATVAIQKNVRDSAHVEPERVDRLERLE